MSTINFTCRHCRSETSFPRSLLGTKGACRNCQKIFVITDSQHTSVGQYFIKRENKVFGPIAADYLIPENFLPTDQIGTTRNGPWKLASSFPSFTYTKSLPETDSKKTADSETPAIEIREFNFKCATGHLMKASRLAEGRVIKCPTCGSPTVIPSFCDSLSYDIVEETAQFISGLERRDWDYLDEELECPEGYEWDKEASECVERQCVKRKWGWDIDERIAVAVVIAGVILELLFPFFSIWFLGAIIVTLTLTIISNPRWDWEVISALSVIGGLVVAIIKAVKLFIHWFQSDPPTETTQATETTQDFFVRVLSPVKSWIHTDLGAMICVGLFAVFVLLLAGAFVTAGGEVVKDTIKGAGKAWRGD